MDCFNKRGQKFDDVRKNGYLRKKVMTSEFLFMTSPTKFYCVIQITM